MLGARGTDSSLFAFGRMRRWLLVRQSIQVVEVFVLLVVADRHLLLRLCTGLRVSPREASMAGCKERKTHLGGGGFLRRRFGLFRGRRSRLSCVAQVQVDARFALCRRFGFRRRFGSRGSSSLGL